MLQSWDEELLSLPGHLQERLAWVNDTMKLYRCHGDSSNYSALLVDPLSVF